MGFFDKNKNILLGLLVLILLGLSVFAGASLIKDDLPSVDDEARPQLKVSNSEEYLEDSASSASSEEGARPVVGQDEPAVDDIAQQQAAAEPEQAQIAVQQPEPRDQSPKVVANLLNCLDCTFAPVDKNNQLPASYNPGGTLSSASAAFGLLVDDAAGFGHSIEAVSSFRSYATQESTFNYWVSQEQARGLPYAQAVDAANVYSARPGHSEHQLGTAYDVKCTGCVAFDASQNAAIYQYVENNAHRFGFVVSYPRNSEHLTGYTYEPWHIRWIGIDLATELYNTGYINGNGSYLTQFLISISKGY